MLFAILVFFTQVCVAQAYKYISMEDGLGSQKVYRIRFFRIYVVPYSGRSGPLQWQGNQTL